MPVQPGGQLLFPVSPEDLDGCILGFGAVTKLRHPPEHDRHFIGLLNGRLGVLAEPARQLPVVRSIGGSHLGGPVGAVAGTTGGSAAGAKVWSSVRSRVSPYRSSGGALVTVSRRSWRSARR